jgi:hypothetical protein
MDRDRNPLVLDPRLRDLGGGRLRTRHDRGHQLRRAVLQPVQADVRKVREVDQGRDLVRTPPGDDRDGAVPLDEPGERVSGSVDRPCELGAGDDLRERAVEVEDDARDVRQLPQRVEVSPP